MSKLTNLKAIEYTRDITVAALQNSSNQTLTDKNGEAVAAFMQRIHDKLMELGSEESAD